jgi:ADP-ribose pyrophosphatase YjhB (NUDIX family)
MTTLAQQLALWADQLRELSAWGLHFTTNPYDKERYQKLQKIAIAIQALATNEPPEQIEALQAPILLHVTPFVGGDAAVIDEAGRILLIRRADNGMWAMPGGSLEVGETPAQGIVRECLEETGVHCRPVTLIGVFDSRLCGSRSRYHLYHLQFLCQPLDIPPLEPPPHAHEVLETGWFAETALPSQIDPGHISRIPEAFRVWHGDRRPFFDV